MARLCCLLAEARGVEAGPMDGSTTRGVVPRRRGSAGMVRRYNEESENVSQEWLDAVVPTAGLPDGGLPVGLGAVRVGRQRHERTAETDRVRRARRLAELRLQSEDLQRKQSHQRSELYGGRWIGRKNRKGNHPTQHEP